AIDGRGYLGTGIESIGETSAVVFDDLWEYNPADNAWTKMAGFAGQARGAAIAFTLESRVYIGTGTDSNRRTLRDFWQARIPVRGREARAVHEGGSR
ncbi:MAG: kelch repeat-containing protein, partial [candidate division NC10 bacterium]